MKANKNLAKILSFSLLLMALIFVSCKDDDKEPENVDTNEIVGKWQLTAINSPATGTSVTELPTIKLLAPCIFDLKFTFTANNQVTLSDCEAATLVINSFIPVSAETKWKVENNSLTLTNGTTSQSLPLSQSKDAMTITVNTNTGTGPAVNALLVFKRI